MLNLQHFIDFKEDNANRELTRPILGAALYVFSRAQF